MMLVGVLQASLMLTLQCYEALARSLEALVPVVVQDVSMNH